MNSTFQGHSRSNIMVPFDSPYIPINTCILTTCTCYSCSKFSSISYPCYHYAKILDLPQQGNFSQNRITSSWVGGSLPPRTKLAAQIPFQIFCSQYHTTCTIVLGASIVSIAWPQILLSIPHVYHVPV